MPHSVHALFHLEINQIGQKNRVAGEQLDSVVRDKRDYLLPRLTHEGCNPIKEPAPFSLSSSTKFTTMLIGGRPVLPGRFAHPQLPGLAYRVEIGIQRSSSICSSAP